MSNKNYNLKCPDCGKMTDQLVGIGADDLQNQLRRCKECNRKKYPHYDKTCSIIEESQMYQSLSKIIRSSLDN